MKYHSQSLLRGNITMRREVVLYYIYLLWSWRCLPTSILAEEVLPSLVPVQLLPPDQREGSTSHLCERCEYLTSAVPPTPYVPAS